MLDSRYGFTVSSDEQTEDYGSSGTGKYDISSSYFGVYATGLYPISSVFNLYASAGLTSTTLDVDGTFTSSNYPEYNDTSSESNSSTSLAFAFGAGYVVNDKVSINLEYSKLHFGEFDDFDVDMNIGGFNLSAYVLF